MIYEKYYLEHFLPQAAADALLGFSLTLPSTRKVILPWGNLSRFISLGTYSEFPSEYIEKAYGDNKPLSTAPDELKSLAAALTKFAGKPVNYLSLPTYLNEKSGMNFHQHVEDFEQPDQTVYCISLGAVRTIAIRPLGCTDKKKYEYLRPAHGSLYILPSSYNRTHEHAVLDDKSPCGVRVCINGKHQEPPPSGPQVRFGSQAEYPDAVYVGRRNVRGKIKYPDTPFGNYLAKKLGRDTTAAEFRAYAVEKRENETFRAAVEELRGQDLLCPWCKPSEPNCHAKVWLELANAVKP